jgi:lysophospholipase L1-like esterase
MPFGDSITTSVGKTTIHGVAVSAQASYRCWLYYGLRSDVFSFIFTGTQVQNYGGPANCPIPQGQIAFDPHNEGHSGYTAITFLTTSDAFYIDKILTSQSAGTTTPNIPDMVLFHLGTNDVAQGYSVPEITANIGSVIDHFRKANPNVIILLAQIIPCSTTTIYPSPYNSQPWCTKIPALNAAIPAFAAQKTSVTSPVIVVDQYTGFNPAAGKDTYDGLHPNASGEKKMAARWRAAIEAVYNYQPKRTFIPTVAR